MSSSTLLCGASIDNFLCTIPSQASELAVTAVNTFLEDQVADPAKLAKTISRVKSVFCTSHTQNEGGTGHHNGSGDCPSHLPEQKFLFTLPRKVRHTLWQYLDDNSIKNLRSVCQLLKREMDYEVGLSVVLNAEKLRNVWMKSITVRSCHVEKLESVFVLNALSKPEKLEKLTLDADIYVDANIAELLIRKFRNLKMLSLYADDTAELQHLGEDAFSNGLTSSLISRLNSQSQLVSIDVKFDTSRWKLKWNIQLKPQKREKVWKVENVTGEFGFSGLARVADEEIPKKTLESVTVSIPFIQDYDRRIWLTVLQQQNSLTSLTCDLNATHWKEYELIIKANQGTLRKVFLLNITNLCLHCSTPKLGYDRSGRDPMNNTPFDWRVFEKCELLEDVTLIADTFMRHSATSKERRHIPSVNLELLTSPQLLTVWVENFSFSYDQLHFFTGGSEDPHNSRFESCTLKNCKIEDEEISELQFGTKRGRNRNMECLCFGTVCYDKEDLDNYDKYLKEVGPDFDASLVDDMDMLEYLDFIDGHRQIAIKTKKLTFGKVIFNNMDIIGGVLVTSWLALC